MDIVETLERNHAAMGRDVTPYSDAAREIRQLREHLASREDKWHECEEIYLRDMEQLRIELRNVMAQRDALLSRLRWSNVNTGMAYILCGVDCYGISKLMQSAVAAASASDTESEGEGGD